MALIADSTNNPAELSLRKCWNPQCVTESSTTKKCAKCRVAMYCGQECQKAHWSEHKKICVAPTPPKSEYFEEDIGEFSDQDLATLRYSKKEIEAINNHFKAKWEGKSLSKKTLACFEFALLEAGERGVREQIFAPLPAGLSYKQVMTERLNRWGYEAVQAGKEGDLVLFSNAKDLTHMGLCVKDGQIKSKPGNDVSFFAIHSLKRGSDRYGSEVAYYRKNPMKEGAYKEESVPKIERKSQ